VLFITQHGVQFSQKAKFLARLKTMDGPVYVFDIQLHVVNHNNYPVMLTSRHYEIIDICNQVSELSGVGFLGNLPIIPPKGDFSYHNMLYFRSFTAKIKGYYTIISQSDFSEFRIDIPEFQFFADHMLN
jgi:ApaG protein